MDLRSTKNGFLELPVVFIRKHSTWGQIKQSWRSTLKVAVQGTDCTQRCAEGKAELRQEIALDARDKGLRACVLLLSPLLEDELYAKDLIELNGGIVEVGSGWPSGEAKPVLLHISWLDIPALLDIDSACKGQSTTGSLMLLMGDRFVDAFNVYKQQRRFLMSFSVLPLHEQRVAHELKLLLAHIIKNLHNNRLLLDNPTQERMEELLLVSIMNILVDVQLSANKNAVQLTDDKHGPHRDIPPLLWSDADLIASEDFLRIIKHKVLSDLITILQSVLALIFPSKESIYYTGLDEVDKGKEGTKEKIYYMQRAVFDIRELLKHMWQTSDVHARALTEKVVSSEYIHEQMVEIEWKMLLAALGKKDPASFENILRSIHDEKQRQLVEMMAVPLGLVEVTGCEKQKPLTQGALIDTESGLEPNLHAKQMHKSVEREKRKGAIGIDDDTSRGYYVKADDKLLGIGSHQKRGNSEQISQSESVKQGGVHGPNVSLQHDHICQPTFSKNLGGKCTPVHANISQFFLLQDNGWKVAELLQEHADSGWQSQDEKHIDWNDQAYKTDDRQSKPLVNLSLHADQPQVDISPHVMDEGGAAAASKSRSTFHDESDPVVEHPLRMDQQQAAVDFCNTYQAADHSQAARGLGFVDKTFVQDVSDSLVPHHACTHAASSSQAVAYDGAEEDDDDDDHYEDVEVSKARRRKRKNRKPHRARENQDPQCVSHSCMRRSRSSIRKIFLVVIMALIILVTIVGTFWFHAVDMTSSNLENRQCRAFAKGYLP